VNSSPPVENVDNEEFRARVYQLVLPEILALDPKELRKVDLDVRAATDAVVGCLPEIRALRDEMASLPKTDISLIDHLEDYGTALSTDFRGGVNRQAA
jgi:hypothetical protein